MWRMHLDRLLSDGYAAIAVVQSAVKASLALRHINARYCKLKDLGNALDAAAGQPQIVQRASLTRAYRKI